MHLYLSEGLLRSRFPATDARRRNQGLVHQRRPVADITNQNRPHRGLLIPYIQCDGQMPCQRCDQAGQACQYTDDRLRTKVDTLQTRVDTLQTRLDALETLVNAMTPGLSGSLACTDNKNGSEYFYTSRNACGQDDYESTNTISRAKSSPLWSPIAQPKQPEPFCQLFFWKSSTLPMNNHPAEVNKPATLSLPPLPVDAYLSHSESDTWTRTGWTKAYMRHLFDAVFTWEYLPVSHLYRDKFLEDFYCDSDRFCSSALVYAMLAVASQQVNDRHDSSCFLPSRLGSASLYKEAEALLLDPGRTDSLPDAHARGVLSFYHAASGHEEQAERLAHDFIQKITAICQSQPPIGENEHYTRIQTTSYCGAVSLSRYDLCGQHHKPV